MGLISTIFGLACALSTSAGAIEPSSIQAPAQSPAASSAPAAAESSTVRFGGEVSREKVFEREIGYGLVFRLTPTPGDPDSGWRIEVVPKTQPQPPQEKVEFSWVATPPYHFRNERYLDTSYGITAREAVENSPRHFNFVRNLADYQIADQTVNLTIYPNAASELELARMRRDAAKVRAAEGELRILDSRITPGQKKDDPGTIDWIKFEVELKFSPGMSMADILGFDLNTNKPH